MNLWLEDKKIVIIGGTTGIGLSAAKAFVGQGASVVVVGIDEYTCGMAEDDLQGNGVSMVGDAREDDTAVDAIELCINVFGGFDGLYHVAGGSGRRFGDGPLHNLSRDAWEQTFSLNLTSLMLSNKAAVEAFMRFGQKGTILNMTSVLSYSPSPDYFSTHAYAASKSAVLGFVRSVASYYAKHNIRVNAIAPALVETPMSERACNDEHIVSFIQTKQPLDGGRVGDVTDLDGAAIYFMSDASGFTTGQVLSVDGGWSLSEGQIRDGV
ncbi:MAG: short-chain dehydrogenase [Cytophagaceae bacterium SCN 52-12]|nr:MAG: short-chain dehydrogenase [Cytophagaceae bacterium SCN 52-12]